MVCHSSPSPEAILRSSRKSQGVCSERAQPAWRDLSVQCPSVEEAPQSRGHMYMHLYREATAHRLYGYVCRLYGAAFSD